MPDSPARALRSEPDSLTLSEKVHSDHGRYTPHGAPRGTPTMRQHPARHQLDRRTFLRAAALGLTGARLPAAPPEGELLYNGIRLPAEWPPKRTYSPEPMPLP